METGPPPQSGETTMIRFASLTVAVVLFAAVATPVLAKAAMIVA